MPRSISSGLAHVDRAHREPEYRRQRLDGTELAGPRRNSGIADHRHARRLRGDLFEQFQPFPAQAVLEQQKASGVAARSREAVDEAGADGSAMPANTIGTVRVACNRAATDWLLLARMTCGASATNSVAYWRKRPTSPAAQRMSMRALRPSVQPNCSKPCTNPMTRAVAVESSVVAEQRDELATLHSITSSARASSVGGMSMPSALTVGRLITNSNLVDCTTGRSAGLAPLRMRPV